MIMSLCIKCKLFTNKKYVSDDNNSIYLCDLCSVDIGASEESSMYRTTLEQLTREFGKLMTLAELASTTNKNKLPLKVRKQSILLRQELKKFRDVSLRQEKYINEQKIYFNSLLKRGSISRD